MAALLSLKPSFPFLARSPPSVRVSCEVRGSRAVQRVRGVIRNTRELAKHYPAATLSGSGV